MIESIKSSGILDKMFCIVKYAKTKNNFVEFYLYQSKYKNINLKADILENMPYIITSGIGVTLEIAGNSDYFYVDGIDFDTVERVLMKKLKFNRIIYKKHDYDINSYGHNDNYFESKSFREKLKKFKTSSNKIKNDILLSIDYEEVLVVSNSTISYDKRNFHKLFKLSKGKIIETYSSNSYDFVGDKFKISQDDEVCQTLEKHIDFENILLLSKASGSIIHEICGHMIENDFFTKKNPFYHKIFKRVASSILTVTDNPNIFYNNITHMDDEGNELKMETIIDSGVLNGIIGCRYFKQKFINKNIFLRARKESHRHISTGRTYCLVVKPDNKNREIIYNKYPNTLVINSFQTSFFNAKTNKIMCVSKNLSIVKNGMFLPIKGLIKINISGDIVLNSIKEIFNDLEYNEDMCYSSSRYYWTIQS